MASVCADLKQKQTEKKFCRKHFIKCFVSVLTPKPLDCYKKFAPLTAPSGLLASVTTEKTECGSTDTPWLIKAQSGQTIRFTLFNYALSLEWINGTIAVPQKEKHCHVYVILKERTGQDMGATICGGKTRQEVVHETSTNEVEVRMQLGGTSRKRYFLLKYEGRPCSTFEAIVRGGLTAFKVHVNENVFSIFHDYFLCVIDLRDELKSIYIMLHCTSRVQQLGSLSFVQFVLAYRSVCAKRHS